MGYVGPAHGSYVEDVTYRYVGYGGDFDVRNRSRLGWIIPACCGFLLLSLLPLLVWWLLQPVGYDCDKDFLTWEEDWSKKKREFCCEEFGRSCETETIVLPETSPTSPPTPPPTGDPFNCAIGAENTWIKAKHEWCCRVHHRGCPPPPPTPPPTTSPRPPADPFNCAEGFANWHAGWSVAKKDWCCRVHGKGCKDSGAGFVTDLTTSAPVDCDAGFANWQTGWSVGKKDWCCKNEGKGCEVAAGGCK